MYAARIIFCIAALGALLYRDVDSQIVSQTVARIVHTPKPNYAFSTDSADAHATPARSALLTFMDLVRQRNAGNEVQQCPCVLVAGSDKCISYDARFQAATLEEAIITFADTSMDLRIFDERIGGPITPGTFQCSTDECRQCVGMLMLRLRQIGMLQGNVEFSFAVPLESELQPDGCPRLRMSRAVPDAIVPPTPAFVRPVIDEGQRFVVAFDAVSRSSLRKQIDQTLTINRASDGRPLITQFIAEARRPGVTSTTSAVYSATVGNQQQQQSSQRISQQNQQQSPQTQVSTGQQSQQQSQPPSVEQQRVPQQASRAGQQNQQQATNANTNREHVNLPFSMPPPRLIPANDNRPSLPQPLGTQPRQPQQSQTRPSSQQEQNSRLSQQQQGGQQVQVSAGVAANQQIREQQRLQQQPPSQQQPQTWLLPSQQRGPSQQLSNGQISVDVSVNQQRTEQQQVAGQIGLGVRQRGQLPQQQVEGQQSIGLGMRPSVSHLRETVRNHALNDLNNNLVDQVQQQQSPEPRPEPHFEPRQLQNWQSQTEQQQQAQQQLQQQQAQQQLQQQRQQQWQQQQQAQQQQQQQWQQQLQQQRLLQQQQLQPQQQFWTGEQSVPQFAGTNPQTPVASWPQVAMPAGVGGANSSGWGGASPGGWAGGAPSGWGGGHSGGWGAPAAGWGGGGSGGGLRAAVNGLGSSLDNLGGRHRFGGIIGGFRRKRQLEENIIGKRFVISCVERGEVENEDTDFLNLCTACWTWRQLPEEYFPRLLNELVCNENDYCLSGWGECRQRFRNVDVLKRVNGDWRPTTISTASCCDCKVKAGSQIHGLVTGKTK